MLEDFRLKVFLAVADEGSFTRAARTLGISQPAVSQNVAELEKELGRDLFVRNKGSVGLTPAGSLFKEYADRILHWYSAAGDVFGSPGKFRSASPVTIAADSYAVEGILPEMLGGIIALDPGLSFKVVPPGSQDCPDLLMTCRPHSAQLSLEDGDTYIYSFGAVALTDIEGLDAGTIPSGRRLAVWTPYLPLLSLDLAAQVVLDSYSVSMLRGLVSPDLVVLVPKDSRYAPQPTLDIDLSSLRMDLHAVPSPGFAGSEAYRYLRSLPWNKD